MKLKRFTTQLAAAGLIALPLMAHAAGLGKLSVSSALGQPLSAEIELFAADKAELESISATLASNDAFRDAHVDFAPVLSSLRFSVEKKSNGKTVLKVTSSRPVNDPFIDVLVELSWASGKLVREYTVLLDPPGVASAQTVAPVAVVPAQVAPKPARAPATAPTPAPAPAAVSAALQPAPATPPQPAKSAAPAQPRAVPGHVTVKRGDTLISIARQVRPESVSLEQTLVGLYRENTRSFDGNINRLKAGKTLDVPAADAMAAIAQKEAVRELKLQADDWRAYRQKLAGAVVAAPEAKASTGQASSGKITPKVEDKAKPAAAAPKDVLKLSKTAPAPAAKDETHALQEKLRAQEEDAIARQKALDESGARVAMLEKQIQDMRKLVEMKEKAQNTAHAPAVPPAPVAAPAAAPAPKPASKPAPAAPKVQAPAAQPEAAGNWYDPLLADPLYWGGGLAALGLGGVLWWMMAGGARRRKFGNTLEESIMTGGEVRPNTVIGNAAGGSVNTGDTSFLTDFSQAGLGTIDTHDVDPIAEAEVYMAYGRDAQAEEILKEAISKNPDRHEIRVKLLEIYAARRNTAAFEAVAGELYAALGSKPSPLWDRACEMGRGIDPTNPLYGGVQSGASAPAAIVAATAAVAGGAVAFDTEMAEAAVTEVAAPAAAAAPVAVEEPEPEALAFDAGADMLDFDLPAEVAAEPVVQMAAADVSPVEETEAHGGLSFDLSDLDLPAPTEDDLKLDLGLDEDHGPDSKFDFSGLDLDLGEAGGGDLELDEVGTKLDLARAYVEMGDKEGAREILNEVLGEGNDKQKADAKGMLAELG